MQMSKKYIALLVATFMIMAGAVAFCTPSAKAAPTPGLMPDGSVVIFDTTQGPDCALVVGDAFSAELVTHLLSGDMSFSAFVAALVEKNGEPPEGWENGLRKYIEENCTVLDGESARG